MKQSKNDKKYYSSKTIHFIFREEENKKGNSFSGSFAQV